MHGNTLTQPREFPSIQSIAIWSGTGCGSAVFNRVASGFPVFAGFRAKLKAYPMRREPDFFGERELDLVFIAKKLREALRLEELLTTAGLDYAVETDTFMGGLLFRTERVGAFFYVLPEAAGAARDVIVRNGFRGFKPKHRD